PSVNGYLKTVAAISANDVWAVGDYYNISSVAYQTLVEHWDGSNWSIVPSPNVGSLYNHLYGVAAVSASYIWAVGYYDNGNVPYQTLVERYGGPCLTPTPTPTPCPMSFTDVQPSDYFYESVRYLYCHGAISGYGDGTFRPYNLTTRGQFCKIVVLAEGWSIYTPPVPTFRDVPATDPFYGVIETAYNQGIISGYGCGMGCLEYRPGNNVT